MPTERVEDWATFCLGNSDLASFAMSYNESGLGTIEGAYFCIIPIFCAAGKLPHSHEAYSEASYEWINPLPDREIVSQLVLDAIQNLDTKKKHVGDRVAGLARLTLGKGWFKDAEALAEALLADTNEQGKGARRSNYLVWQVLMGVCKEGGNLLNEKLEEYMQVVNNSQTSPDLFIGRYRKPL